MPRLDITPLITALRDRPYDFYIDKRLGFTLIHGPSKHEFWIGNGFWFYGLYRTDGCSCQRAQGGEFSFWQKVKFHRAYRRWRKEWDAVRIEQINEQFAAHFAPCDRNPEGEDPQGLRAEHESAVPEGQAPHREGV